MPSLLATAVFEQDRIGSFLDFRVHDVLPVFALAAGLMTVIWVACTAIVITGYLAGAALVLGVRALVDACARYVRRRRDIEYSQHGGHSKVVYLDRYRRRRQHQRSNNAQTDDPVQPRLDDDPA